MAGALLNGNRSVEEEEDTRRETAGADCIDRCKAVAGQALLPVLDFLPMATFAVGLMMIDDQGSTRLVELLQLSEANALTRNACGWTEARGLQSVVGVKKD
jgi:hypothetical protein